MTPPEETPRSAPAHEDEAVDRLLTGLAERESVRTGGRDEAFLQRFAQEARTGRRRVRKARVRRVLKPLPRRDPVTLVAAAAAVVLLAVASFLLLGGREEGRFLLQSRDVALVHEPEGPVIRSGPAGEFVYTLDRGRVILYAQGEAEILLAERDRVHLHGGRAWFFVEPDSGAFTVETTFGVAQVAGTVFGMSATEESALLQVTDGTVIARSPAGAWSVTGGEAFRFRPAVSRFEPESAMPAPPGWLWDLHARAAVIDWRGIYPSRSPHE